MKYEDLLKEAYKEMPEVKVTGSRYEMPKVKGHVEGNKTIIVNFIQICSSFNRDRQHVLKYLLRELATPGRLEDTRLILGRKLTSKQINDKLENYANTFVLCYECKKPDSKLIYEDGVLYIRCMACGAKHKVKSKI
jgi:translation initiation factor 2 subunit 2